MTLQHSTTETLRSVVDCTATPSSGKDQDQAHPHSNSAPSSRAPARVKG